MHIYMTHLLRAATQGRPLGMALVLACMRAQALGLPLDSDFIDPVTPACAQCMAELAQTGRSSLLLRLTATTTVTLHLVRAAPTKVGVCSAIVGDNAVAAQRWRDHYGTAAVVDLTRREVPCVEAL